MGISLSGFEQLLGLKKKPPQQQQRPQPQPQGRPGLVAGVAHPAMTHYEDGSVSAAPPIAHPMTPGVQGYPGSPDDVDQFGAAAAAPQMTVAPQRMVQPTLRPYQLQNNRPADTVQYGNNPQLLDLRRRLLGL